MRVSIWNESQQHQFECDAESPVLHRGLASGAGLPHECLSGACGSCKAKLIRGGVQNLWQDAPAWSLLRPGEVLLCQCAPIDDCEFEIKTAFAEGNNFRPEYRHGILRNLRRLNKDVASFCVEFDHPVDFLAGQFVTVSLDGIEGSRCYSIVSSKTPARTLDFVIKRKAGGKVSERLFSEGASDQPVTCFGPVGGAVFDPTGTGKIICIGGGSGIAGMLSIVGRAGSSGYLDHHTVDVFFGVRSASDVFFLPELSALAATHPLLRVVIALSEEVPADELRADYPLITFERGMIHEVVAQSFTGPMEGATAFIAGPTPAVNAALRVLLMQLKMPVRSIKYDKFA